MDKLTNMTNMTKFIDKNKLVTFDNVEFCMHTDFTFYMHEIP